MEGEEEHRRLGSQVAALRKQRGLTQAALAAASGLRQSAVSNIENGRGNAKQETLDRLARALNASLRFDPQPASSASHAAISTYATGGGGVHFEHLVQARFLVGLLVDSAFSPLWEGAALQEVRFQQRGAGAHFDDVVLVARDQLGQERIVEVAARHRPRFSSTDPKFVALMQDLLSAVRQSSLQCESDLLRLCLAVDFRTPQWQPVEALTQLARDTADGEAFSASVLPARNQPERELAGRLRAALTLAATTLDPRSASITDRQFWRALQALHVIALDLERSNGIDRNSIHVSLTQALQDRDPGIASSLWDRITQLAAGWDAEGARITEAVLRLKLSSQFALSRSVRFANAWAFLLRMTERARSAIQPTLYGGFRIDRTSLKDELVQALQEQVPLLAIGEPGAGKSVVLSDAATSVGGELVILNLRHLPRTLTEFENAIGASLNEVLAGARTGAIRPLLLIDAAEVVQEEGEELLMGLLRAVPREPASWQVCLIGRREAGSKLSELTSRVWPLLTVNTTVVPGLVDQELDLVAQKFPQLHPLLDHPRSRWLMRRPFYIDLVLRRGIHSQLHPERLSEADLLSAFWHTTVQLDDRVGDPKGSPDGRDQVMRTLAVAHINAKPIDDVVPGEHAALTGLRLDGILTSPFDGAAPDFAHDVIRDFAVARVLVRAPQPAQPLVESGAPRWTLRAARIACQVLLASDFPGGRSTSFSHLTTAFAQLAATYGDRWAEVPYEALLTVGDIGQALSDLWTQLLDNTGEGVERLLEVLDRRFDLKGPAELAIWEPVITFLVAHSLEVPPVLLPSVDRAVIVILRTGALHRILIPRPDGSQDSVGAPPASDFPGVARQYLLARTPPARSEGEILKGVALLGPAMDSKAQGFLREAAEANPEELYVVVDETLCARTLADWSPDLLLELAEKYYIRQSPRNGHHAPVLRGGIRDHRPSRAFPFSNWWFGPFYLLLRTNRREAMGFINRMLDYAARFGSRSIVFEALPDFSAAQPTLELNLLNFGPRRYMGDDGVYRWYRGTSNGPFPCISALLAVERIADELLDAGYDLPSIGNFLLSGAQNLAIVGLWVGFLIRHIDQVGKELDELLTAPEVWHYEAARYAGDQSLFHAQQPADCHHEERRQWIFAQVAGWLVLHSDAARQDELRQLGVQLLSHDPTDPVLQNWASQLDAASYDIEPVADGFVVQQMPPQEVVQKLSVGEAARADFLLAHQLAIRYGHGPETSTEVNSQGLLADLREAKRLHMSSPGLASDNLASDAVAAVTAGAVESHFAGRIQLEEGDLEWCTGVVLDCATNAPERAGGLGVIPEERWEQGWDRSAARAIGILVAAFPGEPRIMTALRAICRSPYMETQRALGAALGRVWSAPCTPASATVSSVCFHTAIFDSVLDTVRRLRLGPWDAARQTRPRRAFVDPLTESLEQCASRDLVYTEVFPSAFTLDICARSSACVASEATKVLIALVKLHARAWAAFAGDHHYVDARESNAVHSIAAARVLDGDDALLESMLEAYHAEPSLDGAWLEALASAAGTDQRQHRLVEIWPGLMDRLLGDLPALHAGHDTDALVTGLIPVPRSNVTVWEWPLPEQCDSRIRGLIAVRRHLAGVADALIHFLAVHPLEIQLQFGLDWLSLLVKGSETHLANRTRVGDWLRKLRDAHRGPLPRDTRAKWQLLVDALAGAGDVRCIRLQQEEE